MLVGLIVGVFTRRQSLDLKLICAVLLHPAYIQKSAGTHTRRDSDITPTKYAAVPFLLKSFNKIVVLSEALCLSVAGHAELPLTEHSSCVPRGFVCLNAIQPASAFPSYPVPF